jgi:hypothetical protein
MASGCAYPDHHSAPAALSLNRSIDMPEAYMAGTVLPVNPNPAEAAVSAVAWPAIIGGAVAAAALSLILLALGSGLGLASVSPFANTGASVTTVTAMTAVWLIVTQWLASGLGGYLTGRLRTKWVGLHTHEVFFRDTANGFLTWAAASVITAAFLATAASSVVSRTATVAAEGAGQVAGQVAGQAAARSGGPAADPTGYFVDSLYRSDRPATNDAGASASGRDVRVETSRILLNGLRNGDVPATDKTYLAQLVAARTGLSQADATKRVDDVLAQEKAAEAKVKQAADAARKAGAAFSIATALAMLVGAFIASVAGAMGGRKRDLH